MRRRATLGFAEQDTFTSWRRLYCYLQRAGAASKIKKGARQRERREAKTRIRRGED
jgi:hypothetical protein